MVIEPINDQTTPCHDPRHKVKLNYIIEQVSHLINQMVRRVAGVDVSDIAESVPRLALDAVVVRQERVQSETKSRERRKKIKKMFISRNRLIDGERRSEVSSWR